MSGRNLEEFNGKYAGKTCFVIGSGCSLIDQIPAFQGLAEHVTIAVNSGYLAYPHSNFFISDDWAVVHWSYVFRDLVNSPSTIALLYDQKLANAALMFGQRSVLFKHRKGYALSSPYSHTRPDKFIWEARTSAGSAVHVAHIMGCEYIVLLGVDGRRVGDCRYFWQMPQWQSDKPFRNDGVGIDKFPRCNIKDAPADTDLKSINDYWRKVAATPGLRVYNASPISLIDGIPKISLGDAMAGRFK